MTDGCQQQSERRRGNTAGLTVLSLPPLGRCVCVVVAVKFLYTEKGESMMLVNLHVLRNVSSNDESKSNSLVIVF